MRILNIIINKIKRVSELMISMIKKDKKGIRLLIILLVSIIIMQSIIIYIVIVNNYTIESTIEKNIYPIYEGDIRGLMRLLSDSHQCESHNVIGEQLKRMFRVIHEEAYAKCTNKKKGKIIELLLQDMFESYRYELIDDYSLSKSKEIIKELKDLLKGDYTEQQKKIIQEFIDKFMNECERLENRKRNKDKIIEDIIKEYKNKNKFKNLENITESKKNYYKQIIEIEREKYDKKVIKDMLLIEKMLRDSSNKLNKLIIEGILRKPNK